MRRYMQGTLDFTCGIYAVINALSCTHGLELAQARKIFQETMQALSEQEKIWNSFLSNKTDHYWLIRWLLGRWCMEPPWRLDVRQPFADCLLPAPPPENHPEGRPECRKPDWAGVELYLPESHAPGGPTCPEAAQNEALAVWNALTDWLSKQEGSDGNTRAALLRFHKFVPGGREPLVSHWTTARATNDRTILLHDASAEPGALFVLERRNILPEMQHTALLRIVPESVALLSRPAKTGAWLHDY